MKNQQSADGQTWETYDFERVEDPFMRSKKIARSKNQCQNDQLLRPKQECLSEQRENANVYSVETVK